MTDPWVESRVRAASTSRLFALKWSVIGPSRRVRPWPPPSGHSASQTAIWSPSFSISRTRVTRSTLSEPPRQCGRCCRRSRAKRPNGLTGATSASSCLARSAKRAAGDVVSRTKRLDLAPRPPPTRFQSQPTCRRAGRTRRSDPRIQQDSPISRTWVTRSTLQTSPPTTDLGVETSQTATWARITPASATIRAQILRRAAWHHARLAPASRACRRARTVTGPDRRPTDPAKQPDIEMAALRDEAGGDVDHGGDDHHPEEVRQGRAAAARGT